MPRRRTKTKKIQIGNQTMTYGEGKQVSDMIDSNDLYDKGDFEALRRKLETEGYLFIRSVIPKDIICKARMVMLTQAAKDDCIVIDDKNPLNNGRMYRRGSKFAAGYCLDGATGSETNEREDIDIEKWRQIGPSEICQAVYNGKYIQSFWKCLFGKKATKPLVKQTFLRLMGASGTCQHADYYYFKRDTHVFSGQDGRNAMEASKQYLQAQNMWNPDLYEMKEYKDRKQEKPKNDIDESKEERLVCGICGDIYDLNKLDKDRKERLLYGQNGDIDDFGMEGEWHCPQCALSPLAIYTTWISLSTLNAPKDSILAMCPGTHKLKLWDQPKRNSQIPGDFDTKSKWVIPKQVDYGDIVIFNIKTIHAASMNVSSPRCYRCSFDTRLQLVPIDNDKENVDDNKKYKMKGTIRRSKRSKKKKQNAVRSPHPGIKLKKLIELNDDEQDITESIQTLQLSE